MNRALSQAGIGLSVSCLGVVLLSAVLLYLLRDRSVFRSSSVLFLFLMLAGMAMILIAALIWSVRTPTDTICAAFNWLIQIGFTLTCQHSNATVHAAENQTVSQYQSLTSLFSLHPLFPFSHASVHQDLEVSRHPTHALADLRSFCAFSCSLFLFASLVVFSVC